MRKIELLLDVAEIYSDVGTPKPTLTTAEKCLLSSADKYIFSTELLAERVKPAAPHIVMYGNYKTYNRTLQKKSAETIHLLYAGIIDSHKAGAFNAIEACSHLTEQYQIHIIGFGEAEKLQQRISELNSKSACKVFFDGVKNGQDFIEYGQACDIGLSTQNSYGDYVQSSFPSKILTYLSLGLRVVSCEIAGVKQSKIGHLLTYYQEDDPQAIAKAIQSIDLSEDYDSQAVLQKLDADFVAEMKDFLNFDSN